MATLLRACDSRSDVRRRAFDSRHEAKRCHFLVKLEAINTIIILVISSFLWSFFFYLVTEFCYHMTYFNDSRFTYFMR